MNKAHSIAQWKRIQAAAETSEMVADQLKNTATRLKSEATAALQELGDSTGRGRKAQYKLSDEEVLKLRANLTRPGTRRSIQ